MANITELFTNPGLQHVAEKILCTLDPHSLAVCRLICKSWKTFIQNPKIDDLHLLHHPNTDPASTKYTE